MPICPQNGSLDHSLHSIRLRTADGRPGLLVRLQWDDRLRAALHAAEGLGYLHSHSPQPLPHGAVQPSNILIAEEQGRKSFHLADSCLGIIAQPVGVLCSRSILFTISLNARRLTVACGCVSGKQWHALWLLIGQSASCRVADMPPCDALPSVKTRVQSSSRPGTLLGTAQLSLQNPRCCQTDWTPQPHSCCNIIACIVSIRS